MATERVRKAEKQDAAMRALADAEKDAAERMEAAATLQAEAARIRRDAIRAARDAGVPVKEIAGELDISMARAYQLLAADA